MPGSVEGYLEKLLIIRAIGFVLITIPKLERYFFVLRDDLLRQIQYCDIDD